MPIKKESLEVGLALNTQVTIRLGQAGKCQAGSSIVVKRKRKSEIHNFQNFTFFHSTFDIITFKRTYYDLQTHYSFY